MWLIRITALTIGLLLLALPTTYAQSDKLLEKLNIEHPLGDNLTIEEVVTKFEEESNKKVLLPSFIPFEVTHSGGEYHKDQRMVRVSYYNEDSKERMKIYIFDSPNMNISGETVKLNDGTQAIYRKDDRAIADFILLENNGMKYIIGIDKPAKLKTLIKVASSLQ